MDLVMHVDIMYVDYLIDVGVILQSYIIIFQSNLHYFPSIPMELTIEFCYFPPKFYNFPTKFILFSHRYQRN